MNLPLRKSIHKVRRIEQPRDGADGIVKIFDDIEPAAQGKIQLDLVPVVNYALVDAIEVEPVTAK